jgi:hypothetical protein
MMNLVHLHWILDMAVIDPLRLDWILPSVKTLHLNARSIPGLQVNDYATLIGSAVEEGLIQLSSGDQPLDLADARAALTEYARGLQVSKNRVYIRLTEQGGIAWEQMAAPQWDRFFNYSILLPDNELRVSAVLASMNWDAVVAYLGWLDRLASVDVNWETIRIQTHSNYAATYWKRLDGVHEATVDGIYHLPERYAPTFASDWLLSLSKWRLRPWHRPGWSDEAGAPMHGEHH